jgi:hypothetical protein
MKTKMINSFTLRVVFLSTSMIVVFFSFNLCDAQSVVGKWNQISAKQFLTAEGARTHGKSVLETQMAGIGTVIFEFRANHTYVEKTSHANDPGILTFTGTWTVSENQLVLKLDPVQENPKYNPKKDSSSPKIALVFNSDTMIWTTLYPDGKITSKTEIMFKKI